MFRFIELLEAAKAKRGDSRPSSREAPVVPVPQASSITLALYSHGDAAKIKLENRACIESTVNCEGCGEPHIPWLCPTCGDASTAEMPRCLSVVSSPLEGCEGPSLLCCTSRPKEARTYKHEYESRRTSEWYTHLPYHAPEASREMYAFVATEGERRSGF